MLPVAGWDHEGGVLWWPERRVWGCQAGPLWLSEGNWFLETPNREAPGETFFLDHLDATLMSKTVSLWHQCCIHMLNPHQEYMQTAWFSYSRLTRTQLSSCTNLQDKNMSYLYCNFLTGRKSIFFFQGKLFIIINILLQQKWKWTLRFCLDYCFFSFKAAQDTNYMKSESVLLEDAGWLKLFNWIYTKIR